MHCQLCKCLAVVTLTPSLELVLHACSRVLRVQHQGVHKVGDDALVRNQQRFVHIANTELSRKDPVIAELAMGTVANSSYSLRPVFYQQLDVFRREAELRATLITAKHSTTCQTQQPSVQSPTVSDGVETRQNCS